MTPAKPPKAGRKAPARRAPEPPEEVDDDLEVIDLDAARAARREARAEIPPIRFLGRLWPLPPELPADTIHAFGRLMAGDVSGLDEGMGALFAGGSWEAMKTAAREAGDPLSIDDEVFLLEEACRAFGLDLGEWEASADS